MTCSRRTPVILALVLLCSQIGLITILMWLLGIEPRFALPLFLALGVVGSLRLYECGKGPLVNGQQHTSSKIVLMNCMLAVIFGLLMPAFFSEADYSANRWLFYVNSIILFTGVTAFPILWLVDRFIVVFSKR